MALIEQHFRNIVVKAKLWFDRLFDEAENDNIVPSDLKSYVYRTVVRENVEGAVEILKKRAVEPSILAEERSRCTILVSDILTCLTIPQVLMPSDTHKMKLCFRTYSTGRLNKSSHRICHSSSRLVRTRNSLGLWSD